MSAALGVVHLDQFPTQWRQLGDLLLRFQLLALTGGDLVGRGHQEHVAELALVQALGLQHQVQRLVPRHVLQAQGDIALHGIRGHQVQVGEVGDQLQYRTHVDVLEVQRQFLTGIGEIVLLAPLGVFGGHRLDADGQAIVGLVDQIVVEPARLDGDAGTVGLRAGVDELHRRGEVLDVQANPQRIRQLGLGEVRRILPPCSWISGLKVGSDRSMTTLPSPFSPRWKSMLRMARPAGTYGLGLIGWA